MNTPMLLCLEGLFGRQRSEEPHRMLPEEAGAVCTGLARGPWSALEVAEETFFFEVSLPPVPVIPGCHRTPQT